MIALIGVACVYPYITYGHAAVKAIKAILFSHVTRRFWLSRQWWCLSWA
jgi:hypothetical protein